jgi:PAS domain S-box-containing protein
LIAALFSFGVAVYARRHRAVPGSPYFTALMGAVGWWSLGYALELASTRLDLMMFVGTLEYLGIVLAPVFWLAFVLLYTGRVERLSLSSLLPFLVVPLVTVVLAVTNGAHGLIWREVARDASGPFVALVVDHGVWFWVHTVYSYLLLLLGTGLMVAFLWRSRAVYRGQALVLLIGSLTPWFGNLFYLLGWDPVPNLDLTPLAFVLSGVLTAWGVFRYQLMDVVPVARRVLVDSMRDAMLALDLQDRVVDINPTAEELLERSAQDVVGRKLPHVLPPSCSLLEQYRTLPDAHAELDLELAGASCCYDVQISPLYDRRGLLAGHLIVMRDITHRKGLEASLELQVERFEQLLTVARATTEQPNLDATLKNTLDVAVALTKAEHGSLFLLDERGQVSRSILARGEVPPALEQNLVEQVMAEGLVGWVVRHRELVVVDDVVREPRWLILPDQPYKVGSVLGVPIVQAGRILGALILTHSVPAHFNERDADVMSAAVQQMALAIRNAKTYEEQRRMADQQVILNVVLRSLQRLHRPEQVVQKAADVVAGLTGWPLVALLAPDIRETELHAEAVAGRLAVDADWRVSMEHPLVEQAWQAAMLQHVPDMQAPEGYPLPDMPGVVSLFVVPVMQEQQVRWLLLIGSDVSHAFDADAQLLAESIVEVIALVMRSARLYAALQNELGERQRAEARLRRTLHRTESLYRVSRSLIGTYEQAEIWQTVVNSVVSALDADRVFLILVDGESRSPSNLVSARSNDDVPEVACSPAVLENLTHLVMDRNQPLVFPNREMSAPLMSSVQEECDLIEAGSILMTPLSFRAEDSYGALAAINNPGRPAFTPEDLDLLLAIAAQIAVAARNIRLFQAVAEQRRRLQALVRASRDGVILIGLDLTVLVINQPAVDFLHLGDTPEAWVGRSLWEAMDRLRSHRPVVRTLISEMRRVRSGDEPSAEGEYTVGNRVLHWLDLPVQGEEQALGRLIILQDVTDARYLEKMREDLTHTMVHDLRNPITGIDGALQLLAHTASSLPANYQEVLDIAQSSTSRMLKLVNAILDISRLESGRMPLNRTVFPFSNVVDEVLAMERTLADQQEITLAKTFEADDVLVRADAGLVSRVLQNLLGNALKFTPEGGRVEVRVWQKDEDPGKLYVAVQDNGIGIPPDLQDRLFRKFVTGDTEGAGSGLGLAFCKMVVEAHGGRIWVDSEVDAGTTITFTLPLASVDREPGAGRGS